MSKTKVTEMYLYEGEDANETGPFATGVVLELADGRRIALLSDSALVAYADITKKVAEDE